MSKALKIGIILLCGLMIKPANVLNKSSPNECITTLAPKVEVLQVPEEPTIDAVRIACNHYGILFPDIVVAQSILETGYYTSNVCKNYNNILGLYDSRKKDYFRFEHWAESLRGYRESVEYKYKGDKSSPLDYYIFLDTLPYAEDPMYIHRVRYLVNKHKVQDSIKSKKNEVVYTLLTPSLL